MPFRADDMQSTGGNHCLMPVLPVGFDSSNFIVVSTGHFAQFGIQTAAEYDIGTPASHVGRDGHGPGSARIGNNIGFPLVLLRIEHIVFDAAALKFCGQQF